MGMGTPLTARLRNPGNPTSSIQQSIVNGMRIPFRSQTDFRILESQIGVLTDLLLCGWDLSTSEAAAYTAVAGSSSSQLYSSRLFSSGTVQNIFEPL